MKKFLSLLLALTLVLSLVVVPARANETTDITWTAPTEISAQNDATVARGTSLTLSVTEPTVMKNGSAATKGTDYEISYAWSGLPGGVASSAQNPNQATGTVTGIAGEYTVTCTVTVTAKGDATGGPLTKTLSKNITISDAVLDGDVNTVSFNGRSYAKNAVLYSTNSSNDETSFLNTADKWTIAGYTVNSATNNSGTVTLNVSKTSGSSTVSGNITVNATAATATGGIIVSPSDNHRAGQPLTFSLPNTVNNQSSNHASFSWLIKKGAAELKTGTSKTLAWTPAEDGTYTVTCAVKEGGKEVGTLTLNSLDIAKENYRAEFTAPAAGKQLNGGSVPYSFSFKNYTNSASPTSIDLSTTDITWTVTSGSATFATTKVKGSNGTASNTLTLGNTAGNVTVKATFTYLGKNYTVNFPTITNVVPTYTLGSTYCGYNNSVYRANELVSYATSALTTAGITGVTVGSVALASASANVVTATASNTGYTLAASPTYLGTADLTATVTKSGGGTFKMTFKVPVLPIPYSTSLGTVNAEPYTTGSTYYYNNTYRVTLPTTFNQYYVVSKNTTPNYNVSAAPASGVTTVTLNQNDFVNGQCTLYVIAWNSNYNYNYNWSTGYAGKYYSGAITVTQTNYNINYNGVAGETVQFAQSDFTDFMNEVAEARGDASKTKSYPYVTFDYVTFSLPTTAQGTLYYGGTAMSTSNSSGAFNTRTKVTNLDSVTFVPNAKTTAKTITLNFTLYATRYSSSSTSRGTTVSYSGSVVVNLVREDIKYTVSQGDSVRFDESDFLSYLRSTKGYTSNYTIDYVTFDQSAVSAVNEGSLYTYYNGYNYGGSVKTTDKFYYNATASQNALSDVAFLASRYAKTGETVYIPFTIYARYGTTGTGTRQLTGTVAIKIGQTMNFIDVKTTDYFYDSVKWAVNKGVTTGTSSTTFSPYNPCKRAEIVTFLWRAAGCPEPTTTRNPFRDVNAVTHSSYYKAILWASQKGITSGTSTTAFSPDQVCTRAQIVTFLYRYAGQPSGYYSNPFKDVSATSEASYYNAVLWAVGKGITTGTSATTFSPYASCNRAEAVTFLYRYTNGL